MSSSSSEDASPEQTLIAALKPSTADDALRMLADVPLTDAVLAALTAGDAAVTSTRALKFETSSSCKTKVRVKPVEAPHGLLGFANTG